MPRAEEPGAEEPRAEGPGAEGPGAEGPGAEGPGAEEPRAEAPRAEAAGARERRRGASEYADPFLDAVQLRSLPIEEYWDIECVAPPAWERPLMTEGGLLPPTLADALRESGATVLAEVWSQGGVLERRLECSRACTA